jgi:hypothetical protein
MIRLNSLLKEAFSELEKELRTLGENLGEEMDLYRSGRAGTYFTYNGTYEGFDVTVEYFGRSRSVLQISFSLQNPDLRGKQILRFKTTTSSFPTVSIEEIVNDVSDAAGEFDVESVEQFIEEMKSTAEGTLENQ